MGANDPHAASYVCHVFDVSGMVVTSGVNYGDAIAGADEVCLGDVYEQAEDGKALQLYVIDRLEKDGDAGRFLGQSDGHAYVGEGSEIGKPGDAITLDAKLTFMAPDGEKAEILVIVVQGDTGTGIRCFLPLSPLEPGLEYTLISSSDSPAPVRLSDVASVAFTRGTLITMSDGTQRPVEDIRPGDLVLTRGRGAQPVRHVINRTVRAVGAFAPVAIPKGSLGNANDLVVSQHQRLFLYQRGTARIVETAEMLVRARDLVDGETVLIRKGGFADYVSLVFDDHEVIYAECIPAESLLVNEATRHQLPEDARAELGELQQDHLRATEATSEAFAKARRSILRGPSKG